MQHVDRRTIARLLAAAALPGVAPAQVNAQGKRKDTLTIGLDIGDTHTLDPARQIDYTPPLTLEAVYDTLVTYAPGRYDAVVPRLAATWQRLADAPAWRFTLWPDIVFASGRPVTPADVAFSINRMLAIGGVPARLLGNLAGATASGANTVDVLLHDPELPPLGLLTAPACAALDRTALLAKNGTDLANASTADGATDWLDQNSAGSGSYVLAGWQRRHSIRLVANGRAWGRRPEFRAITLRDMPDSTAQLRAIERGDIDAAFNLIPEHVDALRSNPRVKIVGMTSLDFAYLALNADPVLNPALARPEARQAVASAIDYGDLIERRLGGKAVRPASFLPIGVLGSSAETAGALAPQQNLERARDLLRRAGLASGFGFDLSYPDSAIAGLSYTTLARALRRDLARVGIDARLRPLSPYNLREAYDAGRLQAVLAFWTEPVVDTMRWAESALLRVGPRLHQEDPAALIALAKRAAAAPAEQARTLWGDWQRAMVERANLLSLFQPIYQVAMRTDVTIPLTAAGWLAQLDEARPV